MQSKQKILKIVWWQTPILALHIEKQSPSGVDRAGVFFLCKMKVSLHNIDSLQSEKSIKTLAFALLIKETYVSSAVKNYNPHALQKKLAEKRL